MNGDKKGVVNPTKRVLEQYVAACAKTSIHATQRRSLSYSKISVGRVLGDS